MRFWHVNERETVTIKRGDGILHRVVINTPGGKLELFDSKKTGSNKIAVINAQTQCSLEYGLRFGNGLSYVSNRGVQSITIVYE